MSRWNSRQKTLVFALSGAAFLLTITFAGLFFQPSALQTDFTRANLPPGPDFLFGTDWMGRDMFVRTLAGLSLSIRIGLLTAAVSAVTALLLGTAAAAGRRLDAAVSWLTDLVLGVPHILLVILISLAFGRGFWGVVAGVSLSHWPSLTRLFRGEVLALYHTPYVRAAQKLGAGRRDILRRHLLPHLLPQLLTGLVLQFPHAILHEASVTFLGFGLSSEQPAIGVILSESMRYLTTGKWWLALFPGLSLLLVVALFAALGDCLRRLLDPSSVHE